MNETLYKVLGTRQSAFHGGDGRWTKGRWRSVKGELVPCESGLHLCRLKDLRDWLGPQIWIAEYEGERLDSGNKVVVRRARIVERTPWNDRTARLFACDCAERALRRARRLGYYDDQRSW